MPPAPCGLCSATWYGLCTQCVPQLAAARQLRRRVWGACGGNKTNTMQVGACFILIEVSAPSPVICVGGGGHKINKN
jgi:hypothetical protein